MDLERALRFFTTVARTAHFGRAADELGMTQPPLSQGIKRLEQLLGYPLFVRTTRGVRLSPEGELLLAPAQAVVASAAEFRSIADTITRTEASFVVGLSDRLPDEALAAVAAPARARITGGPSSALLARLERGEIAAAIIEHPSPLPGMHGHSVIRVPAAVAATEQVDSVRELGRRPLILPQRSYSPAVHDLLIDTLGELGWAGTVIEVDGARELVAQLLNGAGWSIVPRGTGLPRGLHVSEIDAVPPLRFRTVWLADAPAEVVAAARGIDDVVREWSRGEPA